MSNPNWHSDTIEAMKGRDINSLLYIREDAAKAAKAAEDLGNQEQAGKYWDEHHYAAMEITRRKKITDKAQ